MARKRGGKGGGYTKQLGATTGRKLKAQARGGLYFAGKGLSRSVRG